MLWLTRTRLGGLGRQGVAELFAKVLAASVVMGAVAFILVTQLDTGGQLGSGPCAGGSGRRRIHCIALVVTCAEAARVWQMVPRAQ